jgi:Tfp pilus assembly protein PilX
MGLIRSTPRAARHRGVVTVLAMLYLVIFALLAVGFYATTTSNGQVSNNESRRYKALGAAESGMDFMRYQLFQVAIPPTTTDNAILTEVQKDLAVQLNGTANLGAKTVGIDAAATQIDVPSISTQYIKLASDGSKFHATITCSGRRIVVKVTGAYSDSTEAATDRAAVQLTYDTSERPTNFFTNNGMASKSTIVIDTRNPILGDPAAHANILSISSTNPPVSIGSASGTSSIAGDITVLAGLNPTVTAGSSVGGTTIQADIMANHVKHLVPADVPEFPTPSTLPYKKYATNIYVGGMGTYDNVLIPPNTNPNFNAGMVIRGILYIQQPNNVKFNGGVNITGVIVCEDLGVGTLLTNVLNFQGNGGIKKGVDQLPNSPEFVGIKADLGGSFIIAPGFDVNFTGNFGSIAGHIVGDRITMQGSSDATISGSLVSLKNPLKITTSGTLSFKLDPNQPHGGLRFSDRYTPMPASYDEVKP